MMVSSPFGNPTQVGGNQEIDREVVSIKLPIMLAPALPEKFAIFIGPEQPGKPGVPFYLFKKVEYTSFSSQRVSVEKPRA